MAHPRIHPIRYISPTRGLCYDTETANNSPQAVEQFLRRRPSVQFVSIRAPRGMWWHIERTDGGYRSTRELGGAPI